MPVLRSVLLLAATCAFSAGLAQAQTWDGGGTNDAWTTAVNWNPNTAPPNDGTAAIVFRGSVRLNPILNVSQSVRSIGFASPSGSFNINDGDIFRSALSISNGILNADNSLQTISVPISLAASQTFAAGSGPLAFGVISGGFALTVSGSFDTSIARLNGAGTALTKTGGGTLTILAGGTCSGPISVTAGALEVTNPSGSATGTGPVSISGGGTLRGTGIIAGPVQNDATVRPRSGVGSLTLLDAYTQGAGGALVIEVGSPSDYGRLAVAGTASLAGTLTITPINGYTPARGDSFEVLTAGAITEQFATLNLPPLPGTEVWQIEYAATALRLTVSGAAPITYQGRLRDGPQLANGPFDFQFRLFDAPTAGSQIGGTQCVDNVAVSEGLFAATIDFGNQYATPDPRFLEVWARPDTGLQCSSSSGFSLLGTRQRLLSSPAAAHASTAFALDAPNGAHPNSVFVDNQGHIGIGTTSPQSPVHVVTPGEGVRIQGPGIGAANSAWIGFRDAAGVQTGYVGDAGTDAAVYLGSDSGNVHLSPAAGVALTATVAGDVGIGTTTPGAKLDVRGDIALGTSGQYRAVANDNNLRVVRGVVCGDSNCTLGSILAGSGFISTHPSTGHFDIVFTPAFSAPPSITATAKGVGSDFFAECFVQTASVTATGATFEVILRHDGTFATRTVHFIAVGPR